MKIAKLVAYICIAALPFQLMGQKSDSCNYVLEGKTFDLETSEALPFVNIQIEGTEIGSVTDENGYFRIENLCEKEYDLLFSYIGYKKLKHHHDFHHPFIEIYMAPDQVTLNSIVVEAEANQSDLQTMTASKLNSEDLDEVASESFADVASQITGVNTISTGQNVAKPIIHGLHSNRILIINNGLRHEFQNWGIEHAPEIDPSMIDNLEVVKGAGTVRFGPDALGGVILLNPPKVELSSPLEGKAEVIGKSNGRSYESNLELQKGFKWFTLMGGASYVKQGDLSAPDYLLTNTGKEEYSYYGGFRVHPFANLDIEGYYSRFNQQLGILRASNFGNLDDLQRALESEQPLIIDSFSYDITSPYQDVQHDLFKASAKYVGGQHAINIQYGYQINKRREFGVRRSDAPNINLELVTESIDLDYRHPDIGILSGKIGVQWQIQANDNQPGTNTVPFIPNFDQERLGVYLIETLNFDKSAIEIGLRYDYMDAYIVGREPDNTIYRNTVVYKSMTATLGYKTQLGEGETFRTNFGTAWRPPNVAELYRFGQHSFFLEYGLWRYTINEEFDVVSTSGGILTEEERPVPTELGYKWINTFEIQKPNFRAEITGYINYLENYINSRPAGLTRTPRGFFLFFINEQTDALFWGIDASAEVKHSKQLSSIIRGSYLWSRDVRRNSNFVGQPPMKLSYDVKFSPMIKGLDRNNFRLNLSYTFEPFQVPRILTIDEFLFANSNGINRFTEDSSNFDIAPPPDGFFLANFSWRASFQRLGWHFQVRNIFNTSYRNYTDRLRYFADDLGRNFILGLSYKF